jgi:ParB family transcriptional regulator, chromosome partitioning protein
LNNKRLDCALLADEMGTGKTVTAACPRGARMQPRLIVGSTALTLNWERELVRWAPSLTVRRLDREACNQLPTPVVIASYEQVRLDSSPIGTATRFDIITGRFLAHQELKKETILAAILDEKVDETTAKVLSISENLIRRDLNRRDLIDACTALYRKYGGSIQAVIDETGLPRAKVSEYVKDDRLSPKLRTLVDKGEVELKAALRAQTAAELSGEIKPDEAVKLAKEMSQMSGVQQAKLVKQIGEEPAASVDDLIEAAKTSEKIIQINVQLGQVLHKALTTYAKDEGTTIDDAARTLIEEGLSGKGLLEE